MGKHFGFIAGSYAVAILVLGVMIVGAVLSYRAAKRRLARAEAARPQ
ncbi:MAG: heme exporter protein CcmD [Rhizobiales bacterium]|nr:heme exporter protein CcmD [Hyphomicrobiales bacterium]